MKWEIVYKYVFAQSALYFAYLIFLVLYILHDQDYFLITCFVLNIFLLAYEVVQMVSDIGEYFVDMWNWVDITRTMLLIAYAVALYLGETMHEFLFTLTALSMIRGITLFRLFSNTRYMVSLLTQVFASLTAFSGVLAYSTLSFALLSLTVGDDESGNTITHQIASMYALQIGGFEVDFITWGPLRWIIFFSSTIVGLVIMMNLLISLLGDTYSKVQESAEIEDLKQLIEIILEIENLYFWKRINHGKQYIQVCDSFRLADSPEPVVKKLAKIKKISMGIQSTASKLATPTQVDTLIAAAMKKNKDENRANKMEILNTLADMSIKIKELSLSKTQAETVEAESEYVPVCLKGHLLSRQDRSFAFCDLCKQFVGTSSMCCDSCNFDMCPACIEWIKATKLFKGSPCSLDHELRETEVEQLKIPGVEIYPYICRCCNEEITEGVVNYCRFCAYAMCSDCRDVIAKAEKIVSKTKCKQSHELKWVMASHYSETKMILNCQECKRKYLGAGTFSCTSCKYDMCVNCFRHKYI